MIGGVAELLDEGLAADDAIHAVFIQRRVAFHREDEVAIILFDGLGDDGFGLIPGGSHDGVIIIERDHRQDDILGEWMSRADKAFRAAGAFKAVQPENRNAWLGFHCMGDLWRKARSKPQSRSRQTAIFQEAAPGNALTSHHVIECFLHRFSSGPRRRGLGERHWPSY